MHLRGSCWIFSSVPDQTEGRFSCVPRMGRILLRQRQRADRLERADCPAGVEGLPVDRLCARKAAEGQLYGKCQSSGAVVGGNTGTLQCTVSIRNGSSHNTRSD